MSRGTGWKRPSTGSPTSSTSDSPGHDDQLVCSLQFPEAEALAEVLDAGRHTHTAARLMHRWALTEPDWDDDHAYKDTVRSWLDLDQHPQLPGVGR